MKQTNKLSQEMVKSALTPGEYSDAAFGLYLRVGKEGTKSWRVKAKQKWAGTVTVTLGKWPALTLAQARDLARAQYNKLRAGENPNETSRKQKAEIEAARQQAKQKTAADEWTLRKALDTYCEVMAEKRSKWTFQMYRQYVKTHVADWANTPLVQLTEADILKRHKHLRDNETNAIAHQAMATVSAMFAFSTKHRMPRQQHAQTSVHAQVMPRPPRW